MKFTRTPPNLRLKTVHPFPSVRMRIKVFQMVWISACIDAHRSISSHTQQRSCEGHYFAGLIAAWKPNPTGSHVAENVTLAVQRVTDLMLNLQTNAELTQALTVFCPFKPQIQNFPIPSGENHRTAGTSQYSAAVRIAATGNSKTPNSGI